MYGCLFLAWRSKVDQQFLWDRPPERDLVSPAPQVTVGPSPVPSRFVPCFIFSLHFLFSANLSSASLPRFNLKIAHGPGGEHTRASISWPWCVCLQHSIASHFASHFEMNPRPTAIEPQPNSTFRVEFPGDVVQQNFLPLLFKFQASLISTSALCLSSPLPTRVPHGVALQYQSTQSS